MTWPKSISLGQKKMISRVKHYPNANVSVYFSTLSYKERARILISRIRNNIKPFTSVSNGPLEVLRNIQLGITEYEDKGNSFSHRVRWFVSTSPTITEIKNFALSDTILLGPNIEFEKHDYTELLQRFQNVYFLVPAPWVTPVLMERINIEDKNIIVWPSGVDTSEWYSEGEALEQALVYLKGEEDDRFKGAIDILEKNEIQFHLVRYGKYTNKQFRKLLMSTKFVVWIGSTESQGLALMQTWSMNVPTYILRKDNFFDAFSKKFFTASSAPYFCNEVGVYSKKEFFDESEFLAFTSNLQMYTPRDYVLRNFTPYKSIVSLASTLNSNMN
jgi:hypothetical protein